jgi:hypothetical protein
MKDRIEENFRNNKICLKRKAKKVNNLLWDVIRKNANKWV